MFRLEDEWVWDSWVADDGDRYHLYFLKVPRVIGDPGLRHTSATVGHATSRDLRTWRVGPPLSRPGSWVRAAGGRPEQGDRRAGRAGLACHPVEMTPERVAPSGRYCLWSVAAPSLVGPWDVAAARPFTGDPDLHAAPLVQRRHGSWVILGFRNLEPYGQDGFEIGDLIPVELDDDGYLVASGSS